MRDDAVGVHATFQKSVRKPMSFDDVDSLKETLRLCLCNAEIASTTRSSEQTVCRWQDHGCKGSDGRTHKLRFVRIGRRRYTHPEDLAEFLGAMNDA